MSENSGIGLKQFNKFIKKKKTDIDIGEELID
jgi:hypothetical protein